MRGYCAIGISHTKTEANVGTLWRSAHNFGAAFLFTLARRYHYRQASDTTHAPKHVPLFHFADVDELKRHLPWGCPLIGVELDERAVNLATFVHPRSGCYLLGAEDHGLTPREREACHFIVQVPGAERCLNVASAGSIVLYDRVAKAAREEGSWNPMRMHAVA
jgi:tRNA G18 (ribose-2'-O)-methylase SpoU